MLVQTMHEFFSVNFNVVSKLPTQECESALPHPQSTSLTRNHCRVFHDSTAPPDAIFQGHNEPNAKHATCNRRLKMQDDTHGFSPNSFAKQPCASHGNCSRKNVRLLLKAQCSWKHHKEGSFPSYNDRERCMPKWFEKTLPSCHVLLVTVRR